MIGDFNQGDVTVFGRSTMTHWKPILLVSSTHMRLFAYLVIFRDFKGEWMVSARSYCGKGLLENIRVRVTLKKPSKERARMETEKWSSLNKGNGSSNGNGNTDNTSHPSSSNVDGGSSARSGQDEDSKKEDEKKEKDESEEDDASYSYVGRYTGITSLFCCCCVRIKQTYFFLLFPDS